MVSKITPFSKPVGVTFDMVMAVKSCTTMILIRMNGSILHRFRSTKIQSGDYDRTCPRSIEDDSKAVLRMILASVDEKVGEYDRLDYLELI